MISKDKKILISSALPYVNGLPHLGHIVGCLLPADVFARFMRLRGFDVLYVSGVDFHGSPAELGAKKQDMDVEDYCNKYAKQHKEIYDRFELSFDCFSSTHSKENKSLVYEAFDILEKNGFILEKTIKQIYSKTDNMFLADRFVGGTCPYCGYEKARGDQCENCTKLLDPSILVNPYSEISGSKDLEFKETKHLFLKMEKLQPDLEKWLNAVSKNWDKQTASIAKKWINEGLKERSISRDLKWGFPINRTGFDDKVFYVWFDAPYGYLSITKEKKPEVFDDFWNSKNSDNVIYYQFMGKDSVPFHSIFFPAVLIGSGDKYKKVDVIKGLSYLNYDGGKFSKSSGRGVFAKDALDELTADYWRYWLLANAPESDDTNFSFDKFTNDINKDLNDVLGNFILRVIKFYNKKFGNTVQSIDNNLKIFVYKEYDSVIKKISDLILLFNNNMENLFFRKAMENIREMWVIGNEFIDKASPWQLIKTDPERTKTILTLAMNLIRIYGLIIAPICPMFSEKILSVLSLKLGKNWIDLENLSEEFNFIKEETIINSPDIMFEKITDSQKEIWKNKFNGNK